MKCKKVAQVRDLTYEQFLFHVEAMSYRLMYEKYRERAYIDQMAQCLLTHKKLCAHSYASEFREELISYAQNLVT